MPQKDLPALTSDDLKKLLLDGGVMFEINRAVLHKFGYSFFVSMDEKTGKLTQMGIIKNGDAEGTIFDPETFKHGTKKYAAFEATYKSNLDARKKVCGWLNQDQPFQVANSPEAMMAQKPEKKNKTPEKKAQGHSEEAPQAPIKLEASVNREMTVPGRPALKSEDHDAFMAESEE